MTVQELINQLTTQDPTDEIFVFPLFENFTIPVHTGDVVLFFDANYDIVNVG